MEGFSAQVTALAQGVIGRDAGFVQHLSNVLTRQQTVLQAQQDQSSATSVAQQDRHCEMLARVKEFDGDDAKLLAEYEQNIESDQPGEFRQELKGRVVDSSRVCLHAERESCARALGDQLSGDNRDCERMRAADCSYQCCSGRSKCKGGQRKFHHTIDAWKNANICNGCRQDETVLLVALGENAMYELSPGKHGG